MGNFSDEERGFFLCRGGKTVEATKLDIDKRVNEIGDKL